ncbi:MAG: hypothetical protein U0234_29165 [Sandaracinus sp.]
MTRALVGWALAASLLVAMAHPSAAEAQRGRRRTPRRPPHTTAQTEEAPAPPPDPFAEEAATPAEAPPPPAAPPPTTTTSSPTPPAAPPPSTSATTTATTTASTAAAPPPPASTASADVGPTPPDLSPLRADYSALMDDMVAARELVATLGQELFQTRVAISVQDRAGDDQSLASFSLELDGTPVFHVEGEIEGGGDGRQVYEGALAPGPHVLTVSMEQRAATDSEYRYVQRDTYRFIVVRDRRTEVGIVLEDDSDIAQHFQNDGEGRYDVHTRVRVATRALE